MYAGFTHTLACNWAQGSLRIRPSQVCSIVYFSWGGQIGTIKGSSLQLTVALVMWPTHHLVLSRSSLKLLQWQFQFISVTSDTLSVSFSVSFFHFPHWCMKCTEIQSFLRVSKFGVSCYVGKVFFRINMLKGKWSCKVNWLALKIA